MQSAGGKQDANRDLVIAQARAIWFDWKDAKRRRSYQAVADKLFELHGHRVQKSTIERWAKDKRWIDGTSAQVLVPQATAAEKALFDNLPEELRKALDPRLGILARTKGLDAIEDMIVKFTEALGDKAAEVAGLVLDPEGEKSETTKSETAETTTRTQKAKAAMMVGTLTTQFASAMQMVQAARSMPSLAHRNFAEGDMLAGQGDKARGEGKLAEAEAHNIIEGGRPNRAKDVGGEIIDQGADETGALEALTAQARER